MTDLHRACPLRRDVSDEPFGPLPDAPAAHLVVQRIVAARGTEDALVAVIRGVQLLVGAPTTSIYLAAGGPATRHQYLTTRYTGRPHWEKLPGGAWTLGGPAGRTTWSEGPVVIEDAHTDPRTSRLVSDATRTVVAVPIRHRRRLVGLLLVEWERSQPPGSADLTLLDTLATYAAIALENARLHERAVENARLEGVNLAARTAADAVGNDLALIHWLAQHAMRQSARGEPIDPSLLQNIASAATSGIQSVQRLLSVGQVDPHGPDRLLPVLDLARTPQAV